MKVLFILSGQYSFPAQRLPVSLNLLPERNVRATSGIAIAGIGVVAYIYVSGHLFQRNEY
jgi:hypothetical protein